MVKTAYNSALAQNEPNKPDTDEALIPEQTNQDVEDGQQAPWRPSRPCYLCVCVALGVMLSVGGVFLYLLLASRGFCGVRDLDEDDLVRLGPIQESIRVLEEEGVELINVLVPEFSHSDPADIVHDFNMGLTAYLNLPLNKCYITPLNTSIVMPPRDLQELLINIKPLNNLPESYVVYERLTVTEQVDDVEEFGSFISSLCRIRETYMLERRADDFAIQKPEDLHCRLIRHFENTFLVETEFCEP
ncbi:integral membrane protein 2B-like isoform X2 [Centroberyx gerrardi]